MCLCDPSLILSTQNAYSCRSYSDFIALRRTAVSSMLSSTKMLILPKSLVANRLFSSFTCLCGRNSQKPFDKRFPITPKDVGKYKEGGSQEMSSKFSKVGVLRPHQPGYRGKDGKFVFVPEMVPEFIVPDLEGFELKPYVSYKVTDVTQSEFTPKDLFDATYSKKVIHDWNDGELDENDPKTKYLKTDSS